MNLGWFRSVVPAAATPQSDAETRRVLAQLIAGHQVVVPTQGSSMRPLVRSGDSVAVDPLVLPVHTGQVVLRVRGRGFVVHRVVGVHDGLVHTQGDNQWIADAPARLSEVLGQARWAIRPSGLHVPLLTGGVWARLWLVALPVFRLLMRSVSSFRRKSSGSRAHDRADDASNERESNGPR